MLHGLWHSLLNKKNTGVQEFRSSGVQEFRSSGVQATDREQGLQSLTEIISVAQERGGIRIPISRAF
jgi:hypothetical protein